jgi:hypothetical protein
MGLDYKTLADYAKARALIDKIESENLSRNTIWIEQSGDRTCQVGRVRYSPQEILILPDRSRDDWYPSYILPHGISRILTKTPNKEYIYFDDSQGVKRHYLVPEGGLRLRKRGSSYEVINPVQDYSISVDRTAARKAREDVEEFINYIRTIWNVVMCPPYNERPYSRNLDSLPDYDDKDAWFQYLLGAKYPKYGGSLTLDTVLQKIRNKKTQEALAYHVVPVPDTKMDHTEHWYMIDALRAAGKLEKWEGKRKKNQ